MVLLTEEAAMRIFDLASVTRHLHCCDVRRFARMSVQVCALAGALTSCAAQVASTKPSKSRTPIYGSRSYPFRGDKTHLLARKLSDNTFEEIPGLLFGGTYDKNLPDLVVYFPSTAETAYTQLVKNGKQENALFGARQIWTLVFTNDRSLVTARSESSTWTGARTPDEAVGRMRKLGAAISLGDSAELARGWSDSSGLQWNRVRSTVPHVGFDGASQSTWASLDEGVERAAPPEGGSQKLLIRSAASDSGSVRLEQLDQRRGFGESALVLAFAKVLGFENIQRTPADVADKTFPLPMMALSDAETLYFGMQKLTLTEGTVDRIRVGLGNRRAYATFGNHGDSNIGISLGPAIVMTRAQDKLDEPVVEPQVFIHVNPWRPQLPPVRPRTLISHAVVGLAVGTRITDKVGFREPTLGISLTHLAGQLGVIGGVGIRKIARPNGAAGSRGRPAAALTYVF
jgi:hypothetical protein